MDPLLLSYWILTALMAMVIWLDATRYRIPNWLNGVLLVLFLPWAVWVHPQIDWISSLLMFALLLGGGFALFALRFMGGGDVKLLAVLGLYVGFSQAGLALVIYMALLGGVLSVALLALRAIVPALLPKLGIRTIPPLFSMGQPVPYGLAIAGAFLMVLWTGRLVVVG